MLLQLCEHQSRFFIGTNPTKASFLQHSKSFRERRQLSNFIKEKCAAICHFNQSNTSGVGTSKSTTLCPKVHFPIRFQKWLHSQLAQMVSLRRLLYELLEQQALPVSFGNKNIYRAHCDTFNKDRQPFEDFHQGIPRMNRPLNSPSKVCSASRCLDAVRVFTRASSSSCSAFSASR